MAINKQGTPLQSSSLAEEEGSWRSIAKASVIMAKKAYGSSDTLNRVLDSSATNVVTFACYDQGFTDIPTKDLTL